MILEIKLWLKKEGNTLTVECSDPPGKVDGSPCVKLGREADYVLEIESEGPITPTRIRSVGLKRIKATATVKVPKAAASKSTVAKQSRTAKSDPPGKTGE